MDLHKETPPLTGSFVRNGGSVEWKAVAASFYAPKEQIANPADGDSYAVAKVSRRFQIPQATAFKVCRMAGLGVR